MNSFDVFDTLLARRHLTSEPIWPQIEREFGIPGYTQARKSADTGSRILSEIYDQLVVQGLITQQQHSIVMRREIELEIEICFPVQVNLDRVAHGDILISDMYLPASAILQLVRSVGLDRQVTLYQSNGDKSQGTVWPKFGGRHRGIHLGDHPNSDYASPVRAGIHGEHFNPATGLNLVEQELFNSGFANIGLLAREIRLRNNPPPDLKPYFDVACDLNLAWLFVIAELINRQHGNRNIVFLGRDCQLLHKLYTAYYDVAYYLPFSRKVAYSQPKDAIDYLRVHSPDNPLFVDLGSTGGTWAHLQNDLDILVAIYSDTSSYSAIKPVPTAKFKYLSQNSVMGPTDLMIEVMNCGDHGHLNRIEVFQDKLMQAHFGEPELPQPIVDTVHQPMADAVRLAPIYRRALREEMSGVSLELLNKAFAGLALEICSRGELLVPLQDFLNKETTYLGQFVNG
jgi:hypothetical protein